jgi:hypothetical protein
MREAPQERGPASCTCYPSLRLRLPPLYTRRRSLTFPTRFTLSQNLAAIIINDGLGTLNFDVGRAAAY